MFSVALFVCVFLSNTTQSNNSKLYSPFTYWRQVQRENAAKTKGEESSYSSKQNPNVVNSLTVTKINEQIRERQYDIVTFDLIIGAIEDIPQIVIVICVRLVFYDFKFDWIGLTSLIMSIFQIFWKSMRVVINRWNCQDSSGVDTYAAYQINQWQTEAAVQSGTRSFPNSPNSNGTAGQEIKIIYQGNEGTKGQVQMTHA